MTSALSCLDEKAMFERLFLEDLRQKIEGLVSYLPKLPVRKSYLEPRSIIDTIASLVEQHTTIAQGLFERRDGLQKERVDLDRYAIFLGALASLVESTRETPDLDFIGLTIREPDMVDHLREAISRITDWKFDLYDRDRGGRHARRAHHRGKGPFRQREKVPERRARTGTRFPAFLQRAQSSRRRSRTSRKGSLKCPWRSSGSMPNAPCSRSGGAPSTSGCGSGSMTGCRCSPRRTAVFETRMCFFINGWMQSQDVDCDQKKAGGDFSARPWCWRKRRSAKRTSIGSRSS